MSRIDYSKWDKIDCSSSDEEEEESPAPRVTRLETPSRVTRTADGELVVEELPDEKKEAPLPPKQQSKPQQEPNWTENGSQVKTEDGLTLYWSQDRYSVCLRLQLAPDITAKDLQVQTQGVLPFRDRYSAVGNDKVASLKLTCNNNKQTLLQGDFPHPIHTTEDCQDEDCQDDTEVLDWEIDRLPGQAYWVTTIHKATPMEGVVIWWRHPLKQFPQIEHANPNTDSGATKAQAFQQAWEEAHRQFREKTQQKKTNLATTTAQAN